MKDTHKIYERFMEAMDKLHGLTAPGDIAAFFNLGQSNISNWATRGFPKNRIDDFADRIGCNYRWLRFGEEPMTNCSIDQNAMLALNKKAASGTAQQTNVFESARPIRKVPVISWTTAGMWNEAIDIYQPGVAEEWATCPRKCSESTFALHVQGDSMTAQHGRSYPHGCLIFVDPEKTSPNTGDRIVARLSGTTDTTFKVFVSDAGKKWLRPLNDSYPSINEEFEVIGTVIGKWEDD